MSATTAPTTSGLTPSPGPVESHARVHRSVEIGARAYRAGVVLCAVAAGAFLLLRREAWPPHEDEALALAIGSDSLGGMLGTVLGERGGAPLHFLVAWTVAHLDGGIGALRLASAVFAVASVPLVAALASRLAERAVGLLAAALAAASWVFLFHGVYGRMYSLFLCTSALSFLALLAAVDRGGKRRWGLWVAAILLTLGTHPYGALVLGSQTLFVALARTRVREGLVALAAVAVLGGPFWYADLVLAGRFDVGVGGGGAKLGAPGPVLAYLARVAGDFSAGWSPVLVPVLALAGLGLWRLGRLRPRSALLVVATFATPTLSLLLARLGSTASPETRHLIFALPFFATIVAAGIVGIGRRRLALAAAITALLVGTEVAWAWTRTPDLFSGDPSARVEARQDLSSWLAETARPDDVYLGYEPAFLEAWAAQGRSGRVVLPRADGRLAAEALRDAGRALGRGVWLFDAYDTNNSVRRLVIPLRLPRPATAYEARVFGPYLLVRTRGRTLTPSGYLRSAAAALIAGHSLGIGDAAVNFQTISRAARLLDYRGPSRSRSTVSR